MPHELIWEEKGLHRCFSGIVSGDEILESNFKLHEHPNFSDIEYIINDFVNVEGHDISPVHTKSYSTSDIIISTQKGLLYIAIVVNQEELLLLAKAYQQQMVDQLFICEIFDTLEKARDWVKIKTD